MGKKYVMTKDMVAPEADVILAIRHQLTASGKEGIFHHVRGHLDENWRLSELDKEAKYNVLCNEYATQAASGNDETELPYIGSKEMIAIGGEWITSHIEQRVSDALTGPAMKEYVLERFKKPFLKYLLFGKKYVTINKT